MEIEEHKWNYTEGRINFIMHIINWKKITTYSKIRVTMTIEITLTGNSSIIRQVKELD